MLYFYLGILGFSFFSVFFMLMYMRLINKIQRLYSKPIYVFSSAILYGLMVVCILIGAIIPAWLGEKLNVYSGSGDVLYLSGLLIFVLSALISAHRINKG